MMNRTMAQLLALAFLCSSGLVWQSLAQKPGAEAAELAEADKLSMEVVKLFNEGKYNEALPLAKRAVELKEKALGKEALALADTLNNLGALYMAKTDYRNADSAYKRSLAIYEKANGAEHISLTVMLDKLAWIRYAQGFSDDAREMLERSLNIKEKATGKESVEVGQSVVYLAQLYEKQGKYKQAVPFYQRAVEVLEKTGADDSFQAQVAEKCSCTMKLNKQGKEAEEFEKRAFARRQKTGEISRKTAGAFGGVLAGKAVFRQEPVYPRAAKYERVSGSVIVQVMVDENGNVASAQTLCGHDYFARVSEEAAKKWRFTPTLLSGVPVQVIGTITFNFNI
jgi:TonB family protein